jgi:hypothetical protein
MCAGERGTYVGAVHHAEWCCQHLNQVSNCWSRTELGYEERAACKRVSLARHLTERKKHLHLSGS